MNRRNTLQQLGFALTIVTVASGPAILAEETLRVLPEACEIALATHAAPPHLREEAGIYVLTEHGFRRARPSQNGFTCVVNRDGPNAIKPTCYDKEGTETILPKVLYFGDQLLNGTPVERIESKVAKKFAAGTFISPRRPGIAYMMSDYNRPFDPSRNELGWFPPHMMFYAPNMTEQDIGFSAEAWRNNRRLPLLAYQGPHGMIIVTTAHERKSDPEIVAVCPDWIGH